MPQFQFEPMKELEYLTQRLKKFADEFPDSFSVEFGKDYNPRYDVMHDDTNVYITVELPGVTKDNVSLKIKDKSLCISGHKPAPSTDSFTVVANQRMYGAFSLTLELPDEVDQASIQAKLDAGLLSVMIKKTIPDTEKEINITID